MTRWGLFDTYGLKVGAINYQDMHISTESTAFIESRSVPKDTIIIYYTLEKVNRDGSPDRRFKYNKKLPVVIIDN